MVVIEHQLKLDRYFRARDFAPVAQAHIMADTESLGEVATKCRWLIIRCRKQREQLAYLRKGVAAVRD
jgi:hypothetical protein